MVIPRDTNAPKKVGPSIGGFEGVGIGLRGSSQGDLALDPPTAPIPTDTAPTPSPNANAHSFSTPLQLRPSTRYNLRSRTQPDQPPSPAPRSDIRHHTPRAAFGAGFICTGCFSPFSAGELWRWGGYGYRKEPLLKRLRESIIGSRRGRSRSAYMREEGDSY
jgi:hypothetical protein